MKSALTKQEWITEAFTQIARANELEAENAYLRERHAEAVAQLPATIEVLEGLLEFPHFWCRANAGDVPSSPCVCGKAQRDNLTKPHLEHLKALTKEAEV